MSAPETLAAMTLDGDDENAGADNTSDQRFGQRASEKDSSRFYATEKDESEKDKSEEDESEEDESEEDDIDESNDDEDEDNDSIGGGNDRDAQSSTYCPICLKKAKLSTCQGCNDMAYCSKTCQQTDWPVHKHLCKQLPTFQATVRPEQHFRAILFPANNVGAGEVLVGAKAPKPKFVWVDKHSDKAPFFPPDGLVEGQSYHNGFMRRRPPVTTQNMVFMHPAIMMDKTRNSCIEAVVGNGYLMRAWPQPGWRGNILIIGLKGDITMRDFRAAVDFFQCYPRNRALVDPSRYHDNTLAGVLTIPKPHIFKPTVEPEVLEVRLSEVMEFYDRKRVHLKILDNLLPIDGLVEIYEHNELNDSNFRVINLNESSLLMVASVSVDVHGKVDLPIEPLPYGPIIYLRTDNKPLLKHHYEALSAFVCLQVTKAANAEGVSEMMMVASGGYTATKQDVESLLTKERFRSFWASYCEDNGLEATPCPLDI